MAFEPTTVETYMQWLRLKDAEEANLDKSPHCIICNRAGPLKVDPECGSKLYCSKKCQKEDWPRHKLLCKDFRKQESRPSPMHRRAIFFKEDEEKSQLVWVECFMSEDGEYEKAARDLFISTSPPRTISILTRNSLRNRLLVNEVEINFRDGFLFDRSKVNRSLFKATAVPTGAKPFWKEPVLIMQKKGRIPDSPYEDITLDNYSNALDRFSLEYDEGITTPLDGLRLEGAIIGIRVACHGSKKLNGASPLVVVEVPLTHSLRGQHQGQNDISPISNMIGLPDRARKIPGDWTNYPTSDGLNSASNKTAGELFTELDTEKPNWGEVSMHWQSDAGDVLLVNADGKHLSSADAHALCIFCSHRLRPRFEQALKCGTDSAKREVMDFINSKSFDAFK